MPDQQQSLKLAAKERVLNEIELEADDPRNFKPTHPQLKQDGVLVRQEDVDRAARQAALISKTDMRMPPVAVSKDKDQYIETMFSELVNNAGSSSPMKANYSDSKVLLYSTLNNKQSAEFLLSQVMDSDI